MDTNTIYKAITIATHAKMTRREEEVRREGGEAAQIMRWEREGESVMHSRRDPVAQKPASPKHSPDVSFMEVNVLRKS